MIYIIYQKINFIAIPVSAKPAKGDRRQKAVNRKQSWAALCRLPSE